MNVKEHSQVGHSLVFHFYDGNEVIAELNKNNEPLFIYTNSGIKTDDILLVEVTNQAVTEGLAKISGSFRILKDAIGSTMEIRDSSGDLVQRYIYSAFGKVLDIKDSSGSSILTDAQISLSHLFAGREYSFKTGLYYNRARFYDPESGRFLQEDPHAGNMDNPTTVFNEYIYGLNNPLKYTDPNGEYAWFAYAAAIFVAFVATEYMAYHNVDKRGNDAFFYVGINLNENGDFDSFTTGGGYGNASVYYNVGENYEQWVLQLQNDSGGVADTYPALSLVGGYGFARLGTKGLTTISPRFARYGVAKGKGGVYVNRFSVGDGPVSNHYHIDFYPVRGPGTMIYTGPTFFYTPINQER